MVQHVIEEDKRYVELFLVEDLQTGLRVLSKDFTVNRDIVLGSPVREQDRSGQCLILVDGREVLVRGIVDRVICPLLLLLGDQTILEETQSFMGPYSYQTLDR